MKNLFCVVLLLFCFQPLTAEQWLVMGFDDYPPFTGKPGSPRVAVQLLTEALERLGYKVDMIPLYRGNFSEIFTNDAIQMSPALWHVKSREETMIFSNPIFENRLVLVGNKGSGAETLSLNELSGKKLGVVEGYAYGEKLENCPAELVMGKTEADLMYKLKKREVDFILTSDLLMVYSKRSKKAAFAHEVEVGLHPQISRPIHFAIKKTTPDAEKIMKELNAEVERMMVDGTYYEILGINRIIADVNGDGKPEVILRGDPAKTINPEEVFYVKGGSMDVPVSEMDQWYMVDGKFYKTLEEIPADKRKKMNKLAEKQIRFSFEE